MLCQRLFGKKSERVDPRQLQLALAQLANEPGPITEPVEMDSGETPVRSHSRRRPTGRRPLPTHLPRRRVEIDIADADKQCACGHTRTRIGEDISERLEYEPASFVVIETVRPKYACPHCHEGVVEAPAPPQAVEKSLAGEGLLAHVVVSKYVDHLPLHRLEGIFARDGIDLPRSTLCGWVADVATALTPIGEQLRRELAAADYLQTDDTTITVLDERGGSFKGRVWTYLDPLTHQVVFDATTTHERDGPAAFLTDFRGALQADAYSGYGGLYQSGRVIEIGCWAHARRRFVGLHDRHRGGADDRADSAALSGRTRGDRPRSRRASSIAAGAVRPVARENRRGTSGSGADRVTEIAGRRRSRSHRQAQPASLCWSPDSPGHAEPI